MTCSSTCDTSLNCQILRASSSLQYIAEKYGCQENNADIRGLRTLIARISCRSREILDKMAFILFIINDRCMINDPCYDRMYQLTRHLRKSTVLVASHVHKLDMSFNHALCTGAGRRSIITLLEEVDGTITRTLAHSQKMLDWVENDTFAAYCKKENCGMCSEHYNDTKYTYCGRVDVAHPPK